MHERTGMHEPACTLGAAATTECRLLLAAAAAGSSSSSSSSSQQQQPASASKHDELRVFLSPPIARPLKTRFFLEFYLHIVASEPACMMHGMLLLQNRHACCMACCCFKTGMRTAWHATASAAAAVAAACMRACVRGRLRDRHHIPADTSAQTQAWRIEFSHRNIRD
jgi:hypothetical protein